ncbi:DUF5618 family protein [Pyrobaculum neutrophilum]|uniref:PaREP8 n=1 Tax=Pyrobaculum neutrophilum (strain DSM 2338 / JCM 9278 / NBRC 100436 / V24Sta) TaxID=444157 RepID=B1YE40_PYRNV|nr:DUF5618 family protein [Pyrobaculum neutrophilum]ACB40053.1 paREP8 [Pyrobaculum neutrophilum V24Sta]
MLEEARRALKAAYEELERFGKTGDPMLVRDAAEKGWLAVVEAVEELLGAYGVEAKTYREKRDALYRLGFAELVDRFAAREKLLHIDCFYDGMCDEQYVREYLKDVEDILDEVRRRLQRLKGRGGG